MLATNEVNAAQPITYDTIFDWVENQVTGGNMVGIEPMEDGRIQFTLTERTGEVKHRVTTTITHYRAGTVLGAIRLAMVDHP